MAVIDTFLKLMVARKAERLVLVPDDVPTLFMADQAIRWLDNWKGLREDPFFIYYTPGAIHAPLLFDEPMREKWSAGKGIWREQHVNA